MNNSIIMSKDKSVLTLTLNRPEHLNGFTDSLATQLRQYIEEYSTDSSIRAIVITGAGRVFSCGMDLDNLLSNGISRAQIQTKLEKLYNPLALTIANSPKPIVCGLNGIAAGGAVALVLGCDIIVAKKNARLVSAFSKIGLMPDCGGSWLYPRAFGIHRSKSLAMLEDDITAQQAFDMGVIAVLADEDNFASLLENTVQKLASASPQAMQMTKKSLNRAQCNDFRAQLALESDWQALAAKSEDFREGVGAFREKREPIFQNGKPEISSK